MPKNPVKAEVNNFIGGFYSDSNSLTVPPNAAKDLLNFELDIDGSLKRRLGMEYEPSYLLFDPPTEANNIYPPNPVLFKWTNAAGISDFSILVVQIDNSLMLFDADAAPISRSGLLGIVVLSDFPKDVKYGMASVDGKLVVAAGIENVAVVSYSSVGFSVVYDKLRTRDFWGIEGKDPEGAKYEADPLYRGSVESAAHLYNLQNQSWAIPKTRDTDGLIADPIAHYRGALGLYPSNSEQVWAGLQYKPDGSGNPTERYYPTMSKDLYGSQGRAAKGFFIIDVLNRGSSRLEAAQKNRDRGNGAVLIYTVPNLPDYTEGGATCISSFAGRVFFAGFSGATVGGDARSPNLKDFVFFSQLVKSSQEVFKCYQEGDPTSRDNSDLLDTDGGFIKIAGADKILSMVPVGNSLVVICSNGVWAITGGSDYGFSPTNYKVDKISSFGCISSSSIVEDRGRVFFWGEEGIFVVAKSQIGDLVAENIIRGRISKFYQRIDIQSRVAATGVNDTFEGKIKWLFDSETGSTSELVFDTSINAFYLFDIKYPSTDIKVIGAFVTTPFTRTSSVDDVVSVADQVLSNLDTVVSDTTIINNAISSVKYLVKVGSKYTFAYYRNSKFKDWELFDGSGVDATGRCVTGELIAGDSSIRKQIQFVNMHFKQTATRDESGSLINTGSCFLRVRWDWAIDSDSNKWSSRRQVFKNHKPVDIDNFDVVTTRNMVRGQGRAFAMELETEPERDCHILGWSLAIDGNPRT